jgi:NAD(P)-dependent dehydrogenase (short-subunit alcohol dehydrogenase family)
MKRFDLSGKIALVTGSTKGIGKRIAEGFAEAGAKVYLHGRDDVKGEKLASGLNAHFVKADLSQSSEVASLAARLLESESHLDILVNNAGLEIVMPFEKFELEIFDRIFQVNTRAVMQLTHLLLPLLKKSQASSIINVTSIHETVPYPHNVAYCMSKSALGMATKVLSVELAPYKIRVNNFAPGAVETDINREVIETIGRDKFAEWIPLGRVASVDEMIEPALFLASDASSYVTGTTLFVDGGYIQNLVRYRP